MAITMTELARRLNLSQSTVSLVMNGRDRGRVRPELAERIRRAADETGFRPNRAAADLRRQCSNTIGVAMAFSNNPHRSELVNELHGEIVRRKYRPLFTFFSTDAEQRTATDLLLSSNLDAIITLEPRLLPDKLELPVVSYFHDDPRFDAVLLASADGLRLTLSHLKELGHRRIGWIGLDGSNERSQLISRLTREAGLEPAVELNIRDADLYRRMERPGALDCLCKLDPNRLPTAVVCHNDMIALLTIRRLHEAGLRVPGDISVIGQDNIFLCTQLTPSLTTIGYENCFVIARKLVDSVFRRMENPDLPRQVELLPPRLFPRERAAAPRIRMNN